MLYIIHYKLYIILYILLYNKHWGYNTEYTRCNFSQKATSEKSW